MFLQGFKPHTALRVIYLALDALPMLYCYWKAAEVTEELESLVHAVRQLPPRDNLAESSYMTTFFLAAIQVCS